MKKVQLPDGREIEIPTDDDETAKKLALRFYQENPIEQKSNKANGLKKDGSTTRDLAGELAGGFNRTMTSGVDWLLGEPANYLLEKAGIDARVPSLEENLTQPKGTFAGEGLATDIASGVGSGMAMAATGQAALQKAAAMRAPGLIKDSLNILKGGTGAQETAIGGISGGGAAAGEEVAGTPGAIVGGMLAPMAAPRRLLGLPDARTPKPKTSKDSLKEPMKDAFEAITKGSIDDIARTADVDADVAKAISELDFKSKPMVSYLSNNPDIIAVDQGLASMVKNGDLDNVGQNFVEEAASKADGIIKTYAGDTDKGAFNVEFLQRARQVSGEIQKSENLLYEQSKKIIDYAGTHKPQQTLDTIKDMSKELGGFDGLPKKVQELAKAIAYKKRVPKDMSGAYLEDQLKVAKSDPSLGFIDLKRREIGMAMDGKESAFSGQDHGLLKKLYGALRSDQDAILMQTPRAANIVKTANKLTVRRKTLETATTDLLGDDLTKTISTAANNAVKGLTTGKADIQGFNKFVKDISLIDPQLRQPAIVHAFDNVFSGSATGTGALNPKQFVSFMDSLNRSPMAKKELYKMMPKLMKRDVENLYTLSKKIASVKGMAGDKHVIKSIFENKGGLLNRMTQVGKNLAGLGVYVASGRGAQGLVNANATRQLLTRNTDKVKAASEVLASDEFHSLLSNVIRDGFDSSAVKVSQGRLLKTKHYKFWQKHISPEEKARIAKQGFANYMLSDEEE